jgi:alpha-L-rhamnosidase
VDGLMKEKAASHLAAAIKRENVADDGTVCPPYSLMTGFIGTAWINEALSDNGHTAVAYRLLQNTSYPSWLYPVQQGATTIWERLNSYTREKGFGGNNRMNSFNHYSFGAVGAWMYNHSLGIQRNENEPAFKHFYLMPEPDPTGGITYAKGYYRSLYGTIYSSWEVKGKDTLYTFIIPPNTSASLLIQAEEGATVKERNTLLKNVAGVRYKGSKGGRWVFELPSGEYRIRVSK